MKSDLGHRSLPRQEKPFQIRDGQSQPALLYCCICSSKLHLDLKPEPHQRAAEPFGAVLSQQSCRQGRIPTPPVSFAMQHPSQALTPELGYDGTSTSGPGSTRKQLVTRDAAADEPMDYDVETVERVYR